MSRVTIVGCGALGSLLAARMIEGGLQVQALQRAGAQRDALRDRGITVRRDRTGRDRQFTLHAVAANPEDLQPTDLAIVLVKAYHTAKLEVAPNLLTENGAVLTLQNGLGNAEQLVRIFGKSHVAAGIATYGAYRISPGTIDWGGDGHILLGPWCPEQDHDWIVDMLRGAGLNAAYTNDPRPALWKKLVINAMVNTVTALTRIRNGQTLESSWAIELMQRLGREAVTAAQRAGVSLDFGEVWAMQEENLGRTAANRTSMLQDVEAGRPTEVDAILGSVLQFARNAEDLPATRTAYSLIKTIDAFLA